MLQYDQIPDRYRAAGGDEALRSAIDNTIRALRLVRGALVAFTWLSAATMTQLAIHPTADVGGTEARPAMTGMAILSALFGLILTWKSAQQHRALALRVETVARWMVATGVTVTFAVAVSVRLELMMSFGIPGVYLLLAAPALMATVLLRQRLARLDALVTQRPVRTVDPHRALGLLAHASELDRSWPRVAAIAVGVGVVLVAVRARLTDG